MSQADACANPKITLRQGWVVLIITFFCKFIAASRNIMKTLLLVITIIFSTTNLFSQSGFDRGFETGYEKGYCHDAGVGCPAPIPPIAPLPTTNENISSYQDGYNRGFEMGLSARNGNSSNRQRYKTASAEPIEYMQRINTADIYAKANILKEAKAKAFELSQSGNYQGSIDISKAGLNLLPNDAEFLMLVGNGYMNLRNYKEALNYLKKANKINPTTNLNKLISEMESGAYQKRIEEKDIAVLRDELNKTAAELQLEIRQNINQKNFTKALELADKLVSQENSWQSYAVRGYIRYMLKNYAESISDYTKSININANSNSYFIRALAKEKLEDYYGTLSDYDKIIESGIPPDNNDMATMYNNKAYTLVKLKKFKEALPLANQAINLNAGKWFIWDTRGEINFKLDNFKQSIEDMTKAISLKPDPNSFFFRGLARIKSGDKTGGCQDLSKSGELGNTEAYTEIKKNCR